MIIVTLSFLENFVFKTVSANDVLKFLLRRAFSKSYTISRDGSVSQLFKAAFLNSSGVVRTGLE